MRARRTQTVPALSGLADDDAARGDARTRAFYDRHGWVEESGASGDARLFGVGAVDGSIRRRLHELRFARITAFLEEARRACGSLRLLEAGCGGNPEGRVVSLASDYTGVDFSATGLQLARRKLEGEIDGDDGRRLRPRRFSLRQADICRLPFGDASFDAVFSAHVLYHLPDPAAQARAMGQMLRVLRPGGRMVLVVANPRPIAFPVRLAKRLVADAPLAGRALGAIRRRTGSSGPVPYRPMPLGWMCRALRAAEPSAAVEVLAYRMASTEINQRLKEDGGAGRHLWRWMARLEERHPRLAARLGTYVQIHVRKRG